MFLFTRYPLIYITTSKRVLLMVLGADLHFYAFVTVPALCYQFMMFGVPCGQCACKYPRPIMPTVFVCQLSSLRGVDEDLFGEGEGMKQCCMFLGRDLCVFVHTHAPICGPQNLFRHVKLYRHLHENNGHFKLALRSKRMLFFPAYVQAPTAAIAGEYEREGKTERGWEGTHHKRLTLSSPHPLKAEDLMCLFFIANIM